MSKILGSGFSIPTRCESTMIPTWGIAFAVVEQIPCNRRSSATVPKAFETMPSLYPALDKSRMVSVVARFDDELALLRRGPIVHEHRLRLAAS